MGMIYNGIAILPSRVVVTSGVPAAPSGLSATAITHDQINISWTDNASDEANFDLQYDTDSGFGSPTTINPGPNISYHFLYGLPENQIQYFRIRATNAQGNSAWSASANATTLDFDFEDQFTTNESNPLTSPRTAEPGAGELVFTDTGGNLSIASNELTVAGGAASWGDPGFYGRNTDDSGFARGFYYEFTFTPVIANAFLNLGWTNSTTLSTSALKHVFFMGNTYGEVAVHDVGNDATQAKFEYVSKFFPGVAYTIRIYAISGGGALWMGKGGHLGSTFRPLGYSLNESDATLYPAMLNYNRAFTMDNVRVVEADPPTLYPAYFNGKSHAQSTTIQRIGRAVSDDVRLGYQVENPVMDLGAGGTWDDAIIAWPYVLKDGATWRMWYSGYDGATWKMGYATSSDGITWTKYGSNPILSPSAPTAWDDTHIKHATVYKDAGAAASKRWKMLYVGENSSGKNQTGYAYAASPEGAWSKGGSNPVIANGAGGAWDDEGAMAMSLVEVDSTFYLFYEGFDNTTWPLSSNIGLVTFTDFEGTYTKEGGNPILSRRNQTQTLTAQTNIGTLSYTIADSSVYSVGQTVWVMNETNQGQQMRITDIPDSTHLTVDTPALFNWIIGSIVQSERSISTRAVVKENGIWKMWVVPFSISYDGGGADLFFETTYYATSSDPDSGWDYVDSELSPPLHLQMLGYDALGGSLIWASTSAENVMFALDADTMARVTI